MSGSSDHSVRMWDIGVGKCEKTLRGHSDWVYSLDLQGNHIYSASWDGSLRVSAFTPCFLTLPFNTCCFRYGKLTIKHSKRDKLDPHLQLISTRPKVQVACPVLLCLLIALLPLPLHLRLRSYSLRSLSNSYNDNLIIYAG